MKNNMRNILAIAVLGGLTIAQVGCKKDYTDPNKATDEQVFSSSKGLTGVVVGLQRVHTLGRASNLYNLVTINGLITNELIVVNTGNTSEVQLAAGGTAVDGNHAMLTTFWSNLNKVIYDADKVLANAPALADKNYASGLIAYASIFKALALGSLSEFWEKIPNGIGTHVNFIDRIDGYKKAITVIDDALAAITANPISAQFLSAIPLTPPPAVQVPGIDISNTLHALKARYSLAAGLYAQALASANLVDLSKKSFFLYDALSLNPLYEVATSTNNVVQPKDSTLGLQPVSLEPSLADKRIAFYTTLNTTILPRYRINGFGAAAASVFPIYLPGEMTLIKAECYARMPDLVNGLIELNKIVTKTPASDPFGVGADLPPLIGPFTQAQLLEQIYKHRCIELFMSGLKLEDMRRFNRPNSERKRNLMPYPLRERDNNPNTPPDPPF